MAGVEPYGSARTARLLAMINIVGADAQIAVMHWKYTYLFWRPVTAIDRRQSQRTVSDCLVTATTTGTTEQRTDRMASAPYRLPIIPSTRPRTVRSPLRSQKS